MTPTEQLAAEVKELKAELELVKASRNRIGVLERRKYLPKIRELEEQNRRWKTLVGLWDAVFQKYQSWAANGVPAKDWPRQVLKDYADCNKHTEIEKGQQ